jgi:hypothetical protein
VALTFAVLGALGEALYWTVGYNLTGDYAHAAGTPIPRGDWLLLAALYAPAIALLLLWIWGYGQSKIGVPPGLRGASWAIKIVLALLAAATLPAWPRWGLYHLQAAVPLLAICSVLVMSYIPAALREASRSAKALGAAALMLVLFSTYAGIDRWSQALSLSTLVGTPRTIYGDSAPGLRLWVDTYASPGSPIFIYGLDAMLYRVLERTPPRPWVPQLPWILAAHDSESRLWPAVERERPPVALTYASGWDAVAGASSGSGEALLRRSYHEATRLQITSYIGASPVTVVCLLRNNEPAP